MYRKLAPPNKARMHTFLAADAPVEVRRGVGHDLTAPKPDLWYMHRGLPFGGIADVFHEIADAPVTDGLVLAALRLVLSGNAGCWPVPDNGLAVRVNCNPVLIIHLHTAQICFTTLNNRLGPVNN
jgi:hypothetical protein